jgi:hypothetical protein
MIYDKHQILTHYIFFQRVYYPSVKYKHLKTYPYLKNTASSFIVARNNVKSLYRATEVLLCLCDRGSVRKKRKQFNNNVAWIICFVPYSHPMTGIKLTNSA